MVVDLIVATSLPILATTVGWVIKRQVATNDKVQELDKKAALFDQGIEDLKELINQRFNSSDQRVERIERSMNGHLKRD
jgi:hypothetical protein